MNLNPESFHRWKHDPVTVEFKNFILSEIVRINEELMHGYGLLGLPSDEMVKRLALLMGKKEAYEQMLGIELDDLEGEK